MIAASTRDAAYAYTLRSTDLGTRIDDVFT